MSQAHRTKNKLLKTYT